MASKTILEPEITAEVVVMLGVDIGSGDIVLGSNGLRAMVVAIIEFCISWAAVVAVMVSTTL